MLRGTIEPVGKYVVYEVVIAGGEIGDTSTLVVKW